MNDNLTTITGTLDRIRFSKDGFLIGEFFTADKQPGQPGCFAALGTMFNPELEMQFKLFGEWANDPKWGKQFRFASYESIRPKDKSGIYKYLVRTCKFVGPKIAERLIEKYGEDTLQVMMDLPVLVSTEINGLTRKKTIEISDTLKLDKHNAAQLIELENMLSVPGIPKKLAELLIVKYKSDAVAKVKDNPYMLIEENRVGFLLADRVAVSIGFDRQSLFRKEAVISHSLDDLCQGHGNVWVNEGLLIAFAESLVPEVKNVDEGLVQLLEDEKITEEDGFISPIRLANNETFIANKLVRMML